MEAWDFERGDGAREAWTRSADPVPAAMSRHRLGFAVKVLGDGGLPSHDSAPLAVEPAPAGVARAPAADPRPARRARHPHVPHGHGARAVRKPSGPPAVPLTDRGVPRRAPRNRRVARRAGIRLSTHPGQYTVLNSEDDAVRAAAVAELEVQAAVLDAMGQPPEAVVVLHVGGAAGGLAAATERFAAGVSQLSDRARARLVVENDDRSFALVDVLPRPPLRAAGRLGRAPPSLPRPRSIPDDAALALALETWPPGVLPKVHYCRRGST